MKPLTQALSPALCHSLTFGRNCELMVKEVEEAVSFILSKNVVVPGIGVVLGSGLGSFRNEIKEAVRISYAEIPNFPVSTVEGHEGELIFGKLGGKNIVAMAGRFHYYEGYTTQQVVFPIRVMKFLGVKTVLISNAAGGTNTDFRVGDLMIIQDHISLLALNPLLGKNESAFGTRFPDMSEPYDKSLISLCKQISEQINIPVHTGVYMGVTGPSFETRSEYKMIKVLGADAVGMSTVQEVIAAVHLGMKVFAMSVISDIGIREEENTITHEEVLQAAREAEPKLSKVFAKMIEAI